jgi:hypothetical protein
VEEVDEKFLEAVDFVAGGTKFCSQPVSRSASSRYRLATSGQPFRIHGLDRKRLLATALR